MSFLNSSATVVNKSVFSPGTSPDRAISLLHDHENFIKCDPHMVSYAPLPASTPSDPLPESIQTRTRQSQPSFYKVIDRVHALPAGLWDKDVESTYELSNIDTGLFVRLRSPMGIMMETTWEVVQHGEKLEMVETNFIKCSRLLLNVVKNQCEANWQDIHAKLHTKLREEQT